MLGVDSQAVTYASEELHIAATSCAAEHKASRNVQLPEPELHIFSVASSASEPIPGWWEGRQLGLVEFSASAAQSNGASFTLNGAYRRASSLEPRATPARYFQALKDMKDSPTSSHLTAWRLGA